MTTIRDIHLNLEKRQILRREGIRQQSSVRPEITNLLGLSSDASLKVFGARFNSESSSESFAILDTSINIILVYIYQ